MKKIFLIFILFSFCFFTSCQKETKIEDNQNKNEIVDNKEETKKEENNNYKKYIHYHIIDDKDEIEEIVDLDNYVLKTYEKPTYYLKGWFTDSKCKEAFSLNDYNWPNEDYTLDLYGKWMEQYYKVIFMADGVEITKQSIRSGDFAVAPKAPSKSGYLFDKWDTDFSNVQSDLIVNAIYKEKGDKRNVFVVLGNWMNDDGTISATMRKRLELTLEAIKKFDPAYIIVSGGLANTKAGITEAQAMYNYLTEHDVPADLIIKEDKSLSTYQNSIYTMTILEDVDFDNLIIISTIEHFVNYQTIKYFNDAALANPKIKEKNINIMIYTNNGSC